MTGSRIVMCTRDDPDYRDVGSVVQGSRRTFTHLRPGQQPRFEIPHYRLYRQMRARRTLINLWGACAIAGFTVLAAVAASPAARCQDGADDLARNHRWLQERQAQRERQPGAGLSAEIGVYADAGAWHPGVRSLVEILEANGVGCRLLDSRGVRPKQLQKLKALVLPGGWAPSQWAALGTDGLAAIEAYVESGGRCLGVCAGAYLVSREVVWEGTVHPYPLGLFDGRAEGPVTSLAPWPKSSPVAVTLTEAGRRWGLPPATEEPCLYLGGPRFLGGSGVEVLARYPDGSAAVVSQKSGRGEVVLSGVHFERPPPGSSDEKAPGPGVFAVLRALLLAGK